MNIFNIIYNKIYSSLFSTNSGYIPVSKNGFWKYRNKPTISLNKTAQLFQKINGKTIIEIGTGLHGDMSGDSLLTWLKRTSAERIIAVDLNNERINELKNLAQQHSRLELVVADGINYLKEFDAFVDLLYLDFWTPDEPSELPGTGRAKAYLKTYINSRNKLSRRSLILIDDTDHIHPWKHTLIVPEARKDGFEVVFTGRQTLLQR